MQFLIGGFPFTHPTSHFFFPQSVKRAPTPKKDISSHTDFNDVYNSQFKEAKDNIRRHPFIDAAEGSFSHSLDTTNLYLNGRFMQKRFLLDWEIYKIENAQQSGSQTRTTKLENLTRPFLTRVVIKYWFAGTATSLKLFQQLSQLVGKLDISFFFSQERKFQISNVCFSLSWKEKSALQQIREIHLFREPDKMSLFQKTAIGWWSKKT